MSDFLEILIFSLIAGTLYSLVVLGYSLVYSILGYVNFAHGEMLTIGVYICWFLDSIGLNMVSTIILSLMLTGIISFILGRYIMVPARRRSSLTALVVAIGISIIIQNLLALIFNADAKTFYPDQLNQSIYFFNTSLKVSSIISFFSAVLLLVIIWFGFLKNTNIGLEIRACASNSIAAYTTGLRQNKVFGIVFLISGVFAAFAGIAIGFDNHIITPTLGFAFGLRAFIASVIGGISNFRGAIGGAFILAFSENIITYLLLTLPLLGAVSPIISKDVIAIVVLTIILIYKPTGLFSRNIILRP